MDDNLRNTDQMAHFLSKIDKDALKQRN